MATVTVYPTSYSVIKGTWNNPTNMYADDGSYTTTTLSGYDNSCTIAYNFPSANIPAGATINSVTLQTQWKASSTTARLSSNIQMGYDGTLVGSLSEDKASTTSDRTQNCTTTGTWTVEQLNSGLAYARINASKGNLFASGTCSFDYLCIIVDHTEGSEEYFKELIASVAASDLFTRKTGKTAAGAVSAGAAAVKSANNMRKYVLTAFSGVTSGMIKKAGKISVSYFSVTASIQRVIKKAVNAAVNTTGTAVKKAVKTVRGTAGTSASFVRKVKIIRTAAIKITAFVRFPFKIIRYVLLSWIIRDKQLTTVLRAKDLSHKEREKQLNTAERAKELEIKERKVDLEVRE